MPTGGSFPLISTDCQGNTTRTIHSPAWSTNSNLGYPRPRRTRPKGADLLFNPTSFSRERMKWMDAVCHSTYQCAPGSKVRSQTIAASLKETFGLSWYIPPQTDRTASFRSRLLGKIKNQQVNIGQLIAEHKQTANLFVEAGLMLADTIRSAKRGRPPKWLSTKGSANKWLAYYFGVRPLVNDIEGMLKILDGALDRPLIFSVGLAKLTEKGERTQIVPHWNYLQPAGKRVDRWTSTYKAKAHVQVESPAVQTAASLGLINAPALAWELVPFSFLVDWFINVGGYLNNLDALSGVQRVAATWGVQTVSETEVTGGSAQGYANYLFTNRNVLALDQNVRPQFGKGLHTLRVITVAALIRQRWRE